MRFTLSMVVLLMVFTGLAAGALAQEVQEEKKAQPLSPLQTQLQKMQSGEQYGMKTIGVAPPAPRDKPKEALNDNAKALAEKAQIENNRPSRLELIQEAYKKAALPAVTNKPEAAKDQEAKSEAKKEIPDDDQVMFRTLQDDTPKVPPRLIPVE